QDQEKPTFQVTLHDDSGTGQVYFLAQLAPPAVRPVQNGVPREVILLVDHSRSMEGAKWEAADWAVKKFLSGLTPRDAFALAVLHDQTAWLAKAPRLADAKAVQKAVGFLEKRKDSGGTELGVAREQALERPRTAGEAARHMLVITDAQVTDEGRILRLADEEARQGQRRRLHVLCVAAAPNTVPARATGERAGCA